MAVGSESFEGHKSDLELSTCSDRKSMEFSKCWCAAWRTLGYSNNASNRVL
jgi:hypothetical protein